MTVLHLAAKFGHVDVLEVLRGKVPWSMASVKVTRCKYTYLLPCFSFMNYFDFSMKYVNNYFPKSYGLTKFKASEAGIILYYSEIEIV